MVLQSEALEVVTRALTDSVMPLLSTLMISVVVIAVFAIIGMELLLGTMHYCSDRLVWTSKGGNTSSTSNTRNTNNTSNTSNNSSFVFKALLFGTSHYCSDRLVRVVTTAAIVTTATNLEIM